MRPFFHRRAVVLLSSFTFGAALAACSAGGSAATVEKNPPPAERPLIHASPAFHSTEAGSVADVVESVLPSVVSVTSMKRASQRNPHDFFLRGPGGSQPQQGLGSGVILTVDGLIVTNNHVIEGADEVEVQTSDGRVFPAKVVGADPKSDVAVLKLEGVSDLIPARVGDSSSLRLGDVVLAVGNPFGVGQTVTMGIVSATGRSDMGIADYENFIQTDAAINPGNSGGALINMRGELVGINTAILSRTGGSMGIGFAIPTDMATPIVEALRTEGKVSRGWLGVGIQNLDADLKEALGMGDADGVLISDVQPKSPADVGGLKSGDVVTHVGNEGVATSGQFRNLIASAGGDSKVVLSIKRGQKQLKLKIDLGTLPKDGEEPELQSRSGESRPAVEGLSLKDLDEVLRKRLNVPPDVDGAVIVRVAPDSKAARAQLRPGDVILQINQQPVSSSSEAEKRYGEVKGARLLQIFRQGGRHFVVVK